MSVESETPEPAEKVSTTYPGKVKRKKLFSFLQKNWIKYTSEFFMLFLAVFLGSMAENQREKMIEHQREEEYIESLINDIKTDIAHAEVVDRSILVMVPSLDTMISSYDNLLKGQPEMFLRNRKAIYIFEDFYATDGTMQQLKSGNLRLLRKRNVVDSILKYDRITRDLLYEQNMISSLSFQRVWDLDVALFDTHKINNFNRFPENLGDILLTSDKQKIGEYYTRLVGLRIVLLGWSQQLSEFQNAGSNLINFLGDEYKIKT